MRHFGRCVSKSVTRLLGFLLAFLPFHSFVDAAEQHEYFALVAGVSKYPAARFRNLATGEPDADGLAQALMERGYRKENVTILTETRGEAEARFAPTGENIRRELDLLLENRKPTDVIIIALSGQGLHAKFHPYAFCPSDADPGKPQTMLAIDELYDRLEKCKAGFKLLLLDACREDGLAPVARTKLKQGAQVDLTRPAILDPPEGVALFVSCSKGQYARERNDMDGDTKPVPHSIFFDALIRGLKGDAAQETGIMTLADLDEFVKRDVETYARTRYSAKQFPELLNQIKETPQIVPPQAPKETVSKSTNMRFVMIPPGIFQMGSSDADVAPGQPGAATGQDAFKGERPQHTVRITRPFYLGMYEVTQTEFEQVIGKNPSSFWVVIGQNTSRFPVDKVSWYDAIEFCNKLSDKDGLPEYYRISDIQRGTNAIRSAKVTTTGSTGYRLPTEAEWEYACRAGSTTPYNFGSSCNGREANVAGTTPFGTTTKGPAIGRTTTVGSFTKNSFGLFDMHGNVWEWCEDTYDEKLYAQRKGVTVDPVQLTGADYRVVRGGSWGYEAHHARSASRLKEPPVYRYNNIGLRLARNLR